MDEKPMTVPATLIGGPFDGSDFDLSAILDYPGCRWYVQMPCDSLSSLLAPTELPRKIPSAVYEVASDMGCPSKDDRGRTRLLYQGQY